MKKILLLSLILSLVYLGCKNQPPEEGPPPPPSDENPVIPGTDQSTPVDPGDVDLSEVDPAEVSPCEVTTGQYTSTEELVKPFETAGCVVEGKLDQNCLNRYNYENCYKPKAPSPGSSVVITCTREGNDEERTFTFNTYNLYPGEGLLCDITDDSKNSVLFYARNQASWCQTSWASFKAQQGYTCSDDPPPAEEEQQEETESPTPEVEATDTGSAEPASETYYTITNQTDGATVIISTNDEPINLAEDDCVQLKDDAFAQLSITTDANRDVCEVGECGEAGHYIVERRRTGFLGLGTAYRLEESSANPECSNTL